MINYADPAAWPSRRAYNQFMAEVYRRADKRKKSQAKYIPLLDWVYKARPMLKENRPFELARYPYLEEIYKTKAKRIVIYKASQMGASEFAISYSLHACDIRGGNVLYTFPNATGVSEFSAARIGPAVEVSPYLQNIVGAAKDIATGKTINRVGLKQVRHNYLYLRGATVKIDGRAPQLKSVDADVIIEDEVDEIDPRAEPILEKRLGNSLIDEIIYISTPMYEGLGIHRHFLNSDGREWFVKCEHCNTRQIMTLDNLVIESDNLDRPIAWHQDDRGRAIVACIACKKPLDRLGPGEWVPERPDHDRAGFHITRWFGWKFDLDGLIDALQETDQTKRRETYNQDLGLPYRPKGAGLTKDDLREARRDYAFGQDRSLGRPFMGVDVGGAINVVIRSPEHPETGERRLLYAAEVSSFDEVGRLIKAWRVKRAVIDALPEATLAADLAKSFRAGRVFVSYYGEDKKTTETAKHNIDERLVVVDRTKAIDEVIALFKIGENTLPGNIETVKKYEDQLLAPVRTVEGQKARYVESGPDHYMHAEVYAYIASLPVRETKTGIAVGKVVKGW